MQNINYEEYDWAPKPDTSEISGIPVQLSYEKKEKIFILFPQEEAENRKNEMKQLDLTRQKNQALSDLEMEAKEKAEHLLAKANAMRLEQEDEIKHLNEVRSCTLVFVLFCFYTYPLSYHTIFVLSL